MLWLLYFLSVSVVGVRWIFRRYCFDCRGLFGFGCFLTFLWYYVVWSVIVFFFVIFE